MRKCSRVRQNAIKMPSRESSQGTLRASDVHGRLRTDGTNALEVIDT